MAEERDLLLVLIVDLTNNLAAFSFDMLLKHILLFSHMHLATRHNNSLLVIGANHHTSEILYPSNKDISKLPKPANAYQPFFDLDQQIITNLKDLLVIGHGSPKMANGIALALTYCAKQKIKNIYANARILCISVSEDDPSQYISTMNCIFAAQASEITIDVCSIISHSNQFNSIQLQQAAHITKGIFMTCCEESTLIHHLVQIFLPEPRLRKHLGIPANKSVDFTASCFCHKKPIDIAFVCPICLSIFCDSLDKCNNCG
jgi:transcription initiation factor TFIIH subunit 3